MRFIRDRSVAALALAPLLLGGQARAASNPTTAQIFIGVSNPRLAIPGHGCAGDASRLCCDVDSLGKVVVATGRLEAVAGKDPLDGLWHWKLAGDVSLCLDPGTQAAEKR